MPKEIVKKSTSSKKSDIAPPSADPAMAKKNKKPLTSNEAAFKEKVNNKSVDAPAGGPKREKKSFDRHSRSGKTDTKKKISQGWGDDRREADDEAAGLADANAELANENKEEPAVPAGKSLKEYLAEQEQSLASFIKTATRKANEGAEDKWNSFEKIEKETKDFVEATHGKRVRQRAAKEKKLLNFTSTFGEDISKFNGKKTGFKGKKTDGKKPAAINDQTFPSL